MAYCKICQTTDAALFYPNRATGFTLLSWAGERRRKAMALKRIWPAQKELF